MKTVHFGEQNKINPNSMALLSAWYTRYPLCVVTGEWLSQVHAHAHWDWLLDLPPERAVSRSLLLSVPQKQLKVVFLTQLRERFHIDAGIAVSWCFIFRVRQFEVEVRAVDTQSDIFCVKKKKKNSVAWVRERTIPTERPPLASEISSNFCC
jgi:hypothetical protein